MTRRQFEEQLLQLKELLTKMGELNCEAIEDAVCALETQDTELARKTKGVETLVDEKEQEIERLCLKIIVKQQPVASDLLFVTSAMKMITDMERIADQAVDISELVIKMSRLPYADSVAEISDMADRVQEMVRAAAKSFVERDGELAKAVCRADDAVDDLFEVIKRKLTGIVHREIEGDDNGEQALDLLMVAKYLEKIGDHASNIAEWVIFMITGEHKKLN
ncbi:MAG TPA: phosphate signaling complex protein PhoU [Candidatus Borkfalkia faecipullorum]|uniref:Phosphate-specific transport system accessory protein PhoU n=1 Tax=Candidatus Borkfalkia faecipullorum TaxID=2838510 RepID=A0A9D2AEQ2_9FIRM|nr:phosphate signaling complex protein PhoU [Candidatus Borkfalkia faecipullorum]